MSRAGYWDFQTNSYSADDLCDTVAATKLEGTLMTLCIYQLTVIITISTTHALSAHLRAGRVQSLFCCSVIDPCCAHQPVRCTLIVNNNGDSLFNGHCKVHSEMILPLAVLESHSRFTLVSIGLSTNWSWWTYSCVHQLVVSGSCNMSNLVHPAPVPDNPNLHQTGPTSPLFNLSINFKPDGQSHQGIATQSVEYCSSAI